LGSGQIGIELNSHDPPAPGITKSEARRTPPASSQRTCSGTLADGTLTWRSDVSDAKSRRIAPMRYVEYAQFTRNAARHASTTLCTTTCSHVSTRCSNGAVFALLLALLLLLVADDGLLDLPLIDRSENLLAK
jgi:hypothetical protein